MSPEHFSGPLLSAGREETIDCNQATAISLLGLSVRGVLAAHHRWAGGSRCSLRNSGLSQTMEQHTHTRTAAGIEIRGEMS